MPPMGEPVGEDKAILVVFEVRKLWFSFLIFLWLTKLLRLFFVHPTRPRKGQGRVGLVVFVLLST